MGINACEQCHGYHNIKHPDDEMLNEANSSVCSECHSEGEDGFQTAILIYNELKTLSILYDSVKNKSEAINIMGMNNSEIQFALQNIKQNLIHSRTLIHSFDTSKVFEQTREGKLNAYSAFKLAGKEESDYFERRLGYGISTLLLVLLAAALFWKIKSLKN